MVFSPFFLYIIIIFVPFVRCIVCVCVCYTYIEESVQWVNIIIHSVPETAVGPRRRRHWRDTPKIPNARPTHIRVQYDSQSFNLMRITAITTTCENFWTEGEGRTRENRLRGKKKTNEQKKKGFRWDPPDIENSQKSPADKYLPSRWPQNPTKTWLNADRSERSRWTALREAHVSIAYICPHAYGVPGVANVPVRDPYTDRKWFKSFSKRKKRSRTRIDWRVSYPIR